MRRSYATALPNVVGTPAVRRPVVSPSHSSRSKGSLLTLFSYFMSQGGFRGGIAGFALGFGAASAYGYYYLLQEYHAASNLILTSVEEMQSSTQKVSTP